MRLYNFIKNLNRPDGKYALSVPDGDIDRGAYVTINGDEITIAYAETGVKINGRWRFLKARTITVSKRANA
jgi:hypothetical protein